LRAALKRFAHGGYAATSVQQIVEERAYPNPRCNIISGQGRPVSGAGERSARRRYRLMREAAARGGTVREQLVEIVAVLFEYFQETAS
jgi:hypothetical protein